MNLKDARVLMVDDTADWIERYRKPLGRATASADFLLHTVETAEELAGEIVRRAPDVVLIDGYLADGVLGDDVVRQLAERGFSGKVVGFSMIPAFTERFQAAGTDAVVKDTHDPERSIEALSVLL